MTTTPLTDVPPPAGTVTVDPWLYGSRLVEGEQIELDGISVWTTAEQNSDGTITRPRVWIDGIRWENPLSPEQARQLAAVLVEAATELDGWNRNGGSTV